MQLTTEQTKALNEIKEFIFSDQKYHILCGRAGTGKSTILKEINNQIIQINQINKILNIPPKQLHFTATTNKACLNLQSITENHVRTIHNILGLKVVNKNQLYQHTDNKFSENDILIIDEASYIDYELLIYIKNTNAKILFVGDKYQLTPVGLNHAPVFTQDYPQSELTELIRQTNAPAIAEQCTQLVDYLKTGINFPKVNLHSQEIIKVDQNTFEQMILEEFTKQDWKAHHSRILAFKNKTVEHYNKLVFENIHNRVMFQAGDVVVNNTYIHPNLCTDQEVVISHIEPCKFKRFNGYIVKVNGSEYLLSKKFTNLDLLSKRLMKYQDEIPYTSLIDEYFHKVKVIDLRAIYASTVHKAQGSTYDKVFIDLKHFKQLKAPKDIARMLYVAISRARQQVILTGEL